MTIQLLTSPNVCFCITWGEHNQLNIENVGDVFWDTVYLREVAKCYCNRRGTYEISLPELLHLCSNRSKSLLKAFHWDISGVFLFTLFNCLCFQFFCLFLCACVLLPALGNNG